MKKVFVLAGGNNQIELIKGIKRRFPGVEVILIDMNPNVRAKAFADRMLVISTMDFDKVLEAAQTENIDAILSACGDQPLRTMAYVSEKMGLPCYLTYSQAQNLTNKVLMKQLMIEGGIPTAKFKRFDITSSISLAGMEFPLILKPADNNGSKGVIKVYSEQEFNQAIEEARKYTISGDLLVEEFKSGEEYSIEAFIDNGIPRIIFASKNIKIGNRNTFTIYKNEYVPNLSASLEERIKDIISAIGRTFGINNVPLLIQLIVNDDEVNVIEFSARTGGGSKLFFIREMTGVDVVDNLLDITFGGTPKVISTPKKEAAAIVYAYTKPGIFSGLENVEELEKRKVISQTYRYKPFGSVINSSNYSADRPVGFLIRGNTDDEVVQKINLVNSRIKIIDEKGNDIMCHELFQ